MIPTFDNVGAPRRSILPLWISLPRPSFASHYFITAQLISDCHDIGSELLAYAEDPRMKLTLYKRAHAA